ncbi:hypothetical protein ABTX34_18145 [Streptomyces sp. NPDC096538]|uniref:hypothetical protein n=1 Tax=Streptomyces sp. NPDC096538 TaxID=3155427 RepID=UPI00331C0184
MTHPRCSALGAETSAMWELSKVYAINGAWALTGFPVARRVLRRMIRRAAGTRPRRTEALARAEL